MDKIFIIIIIILFIVGLILLYPSQIKEPEINPEFNLPHQTTTKTMPAEQTQKSDLELIIVFDNNQFNPELKTGHGFACYIKGLTNDLLFDTGADGQVLLANLQKLQLEPQAVKQVLLSHIHSDHVGGVFDFLSLNAQVKVVLPAVFPTDFQNQVSQTGAQIIAIDNWQELEQNIYSTGVLGSAIPEQSLVIKTEQGLIIITGCAHPGIVSIIKQVKTQLDQPILLVMGGFHLGGYSQSQLLELISDFKELGVKYAAPCHCSGDLARQLFKQEYQDNYLEVGVGKSIKLSQLK